MKITYTLLAAALLFTACQSSTAEQEVTADTKAAADVPTGVAFTEKQFKDAGIGLGSATVAEIGTTLRLSGEIDIPPSGLLSISVPFGGFIKQTNLIPGQMVRKGQVLAVLAHPEYIQLQQDYLDTETRIQMAQLEYDRQSELVAAKVAGKKAAQQAQTELNLLLNSRAALIQKLRMIHINPAQLKTGQIKESISIISPINGVVKSVHVNIGKMVTPTDVLFELLDKEHLHLKLNAFEKDLPALTPGQELEFAAQHGTETYRARIMQVGTSVEGDKTIPVHADITRRGAKLIPGMFVTATVRTSKSQSPTLPKEALVDLEGQTYIFVHQGNYQFKRVPVQTGIKTGEVTEVILPENLALSDQIVITGAHNILAKELNAEGED